MDVTLQRYHQGARSTIEGVRHAEVAAVGHATIIFEHDLDAGEIRVMVGDECIFSQLAGDTHAE